MKLQGVARASSFKGNNAGDAHETIGEGVRDSEGNAPVEPAGRPDSVTHQLVLERQVAQLARVGAAVAEGVEGGADHGGVYEDDDVALRSV